MSRVDLSRSGSARMVLVLSTAAETTLAGPKWRPLGWRKECTRSPTGGLTPVGPRGSLQGISIFLQNDATHVVFPRRRSAPS